MRWIPDGSGSTYPCTASLRPSFWKELVCHTCNTNKYNLQLTLLYWRRHGGLCAQIFTRGTWNVKHTGLSLQGKGWKTSLSAQKAGAEPLSSLGTSVLSIVARNFSSIGPSPDPHSKSVFPSHSIEPIFTDFTNSFDVVSSHLHLAYLSSRFMHDLSSMQDWANHHQHSSQQTALCLHMPKETHSGSDSRS